MKNLALGILIASIGVLFTSVYAAGNDVKMATEELSGAVTLEGKPIILIGPKIKIGQKAPDFIVQDTDLSEARLSDLKGKAKLICSVPSLDTPICDLEIRRFNEEASRISSEAMIIFVSMDLPFALKRFCSDAGINNVKTYSDHRNADFGVKYGVLIKDLRLHARAIFITDKNDIVRYVEYVKDVSMHPDYQAALKAFKEIIQK